MSTPAKPRTVASSSLASCVNRYGTAVTTDCELWRVPMTPAIPIPPDHQLTGEIEPWRCCCCKALIYNLDKKGYPAPGAPTPKFWSTRLRAVCSMCYGMMMYIHDNTFLRNEQEKWEAEEARRAENTKKLTGERDYLTGA